MKALLQDAELTYDVVIIDTPPVLPVTDSAVLAQMVGGVIIVADSQRLKRGQLKQALKNLDGVKSGVLGIALNKLNLTGGRYGYSYGYSYGYEYGSKGAGGGRRGSRAKSGRRG